MPGGGHQPQCGHGAVEIDAARCAGCKMCLLACPYGNIHFDKAEGVSGKCDLCGGDPMCVRSCTSAALRYVEADEVPDLRREVLDASLRRVLHLDKGEK